ncbi:MAG: methionyl-tRNA formyltransferase [Desulfobacterales bacterium]
MTNSYTIGFMGTPEFAVPSLNALHGAGHRVALVITQPDKPKGRGRKVEPPPVKQTALKLGLPVIQPASLREGQALERLSQLKADFFVVVAFGQILRSEVLAMPRLGCINAHASLLPRYRGPAPIHWALISGETETGVTTMLMDKGLDTGDILMTAREPISPEDTTGSLQGRLAGLGANLLLKTLVGFETGAVRRTAQEHDRATYAPLLKKNDGRIDWNKRAAAIEPFIRGMTPWPGASTFWEGTRIKVFRARVAPDEAKAPPGTVVKVSAKELTVATAEGALSILELQGASGSRMPVSDFLRGHRIPIGATFN